MSRITDAERIMRLLTNAGGNLGRQEIIEQLRLSKDRYRDVASTLADAAAVARNRGRTGGLRLLEAPHRRNRERPRATSPETGSGVGKRHLKGTDGVALQLSELRTATPE